MVYEQNNFYWPQSHNNVVRNILGKAKHGTQVNYILGNHDEAFRKWLDHSWILGHVSVANETEYITKNNKKMLVIHGDLFDTIIPNQSSYQPVLCSSHNASDV